MPLEKSFVAKTMEISAKAQGYVHVLPVPMSVANAFVAKKVKRLVASIDGQEHFHCALMSLGEGAGYGIMLSKSKQEKFGIWDKDNFQVTLLEDESEYGLPMPIEWEEVIALDEVAWEIFNGLTPGRKRSVLHLVGSPKREETRIQRALRIAENLKLGFHQPKDFLKKISLSSLDNC